MIKEVDALGVINFLSIALMGGIAWFLRSMWLDMKQMRNELTILQTEHRVTVERCKNHEL